MYCLTWDPNVMFTNSIVQRCHVVASLWPFLATAAPPLSSRFPFRAELHSQCHVGRMPGWVGRGGTETSRWAGPDNLPPWMLAVVAHSPMATLSIHGWRCFPPHQAMPFHYSSRNSRIFTVFVGYVVHCFSRIGYTSSLP